MPVSPDACGWAAGEATTTCPLPGDSPDADDSFGAGEAASEASGVGSCEGVSGVLMVNGRESLAQTVPHFLSTRDGVLGAKSGSATT